MCAPGLYFFELSLGQELLLVNADPKQIESLIMNLAIWARESMNGKGKLIVTTANEAFDEERSREYLDAAPGEYVLLSLSDTGRGMDVRERSHLFEPFYRAEFDQKNSGLGLASVYGIVMQNKGIIDVDSGVDRGTTFRVYLPGTSREADPTVPRKPSKRELGKR